MYARMKLIFMRKVGVLAGIAVVFLIFSGNSTSAQQQIKVNVSPSVSASINGQLELDRKKYFNLAASSSEINWNIQDQTRFDYYFKDLEMTVGRQLGLVYGETRWGNGLREDAARPGYMDIAFFKSKMNPNDNGLDALKGIFGNRQGLVTHDRRSAYPDFMETYTKSGGEEEKYPTNNEAAAEIVAHLLKYKYTDFQRPSYFELVNEPGWRFWGDQRFAEFHTAAKQKVDEMGISTEIGGPCYSVSYFYRKEYDQLSNITNFIDATNFELDFYSFHSYDYMKWDESAKDFTGSVSSGLPLDGVFDALASYTYNKFGKELSFIGSEHGGYITDPQNREDALNALADQHFPGSGFEHEMEKRSIDNFIMVNSAIANTLTFMNHPHIVKKTVPFILLESSRWDPYYYSSLLVKENFDKNSDKWAESKLIDFFRYFDGVKGRRVESFTTDTDIQHMSFVDGNTLTMLFHNQSNEEGTIDIDIDDIGNSIEELKIRRLGRGNDFRPVFEETTLSSVNDIQIGAQESIVLFATYQNTIQEDDIVDEIAHYAAETATKFSGSKTFTVQIPDHKRAKYAIVRVGLNRPSGASKDVNITLNGVSLSVPVENAADRITQSDNGYSTTKIIKVAGRFLKESNDIEVSFPDGKSGGVGAVVLRAAIMGQERVDVVTGIESHLGQNFIMYPNPADRRLTVKTSKPGEIQIINLTGKVMLTSELSQGSTSLDLGDLAKGSYIIQFMHMDGVSSKKLILK
ncbi:T9SS type A sorting domain-containing protein [Fulvivirga sp. M361]|nr:T9SS type A sorting domain-containing protein [Fulvivirga sp. M361]